MKKNLKGGQNMVNIIIKFLGKVLVIIFYIIAIFSIIIFVLWLIVFESESIDDGYKDDLTLTREWIKEHERKI